MTDPSPQRSRALYWSTPAARGSGDSPHRRPRLATLAVAGVLGAALSPAFAAAPALAAPTSPCQASFGATAAADVLNLRLLDVAPLGLALPTVADLTVSSTRSGVAGGTDPKAAALATYLTARLLGRNVSPAILAAKAEQHAPPSNASPVTVPTAGVDLPGVRVGTGGLSAHATLTDAQRCDPTTGPAAASTAKLVDAALLPGRAGKGLANLGALATDTNAHLTRTGNRFDATAVASASVADFTLFGGSSAAVGVHVISQPTLRATAGGSKARSSVEYSAPVLEVSVPGAGTRRLEGQGRHLDLAVPVDVPSAGAAKALAAAQGLPLLGGNPLGGLLSSLGAVAGSARESAGASGAGGSAGAAGSANAGGSAGAAGSAGAGGSAKTEAAGNAGPAGAGGLPAVDPIPGLPDLASSLDQLSQLLNGGTPAAPTGATATGATAAESVRTESRPGTHDGGYGSSAGGGGGGSAGGGPGGGVGGHDSRVAILRIALGDLTKQISDAGVHAKAISVKLQLILRSCGSNGYGDDDHETTLADLNVGVLNTAAAAPAGGMYGGGGGTGGGTGGESSGGGTGGGTGTPGGTGGSGGTPGKGTSAGGSLPVTGNPITLVAGAGTLLVLGGRFLMLLAARRRAAL